MQLLRGLGLKAIEIPTDPNTGISVEALEMALDQWPIKGVILVPNCNNPQGLIKLKTAKNRKDFQRIQNGRLTLSAIF